LADYGIQPKTIGFAELQRSYYERNEPGSKQVRLIVRADLEDGTALVIRFKNETDVTLELVESQSRFAHEMKKHAISTPVQYHANGNFANLYCIGGYEVIVTVEQFVQGQLEVVDPDVARKTGELLARMHTISEDLNLHVQNAVIFDPFAHNDLFAYDEFAALGPVFQGEDRVLFDKITAAYEQHMAVLAPLKHRARYAVQGDISDCNLYLTPAGEVGVFDYNRAGDNILFCDAVMQAVFEARLMVYPEPRAADYEEQVLNAFLDGYSAVRPFSEEEKRFYPSLYAIITAFWSMDICYDEKSLLNAYQAGDAGRVHEWLEEVERRLKNAL